MCVVGLFAVDVVMVCMCAVDGVFVVHTRRRHV
jgi:hypothetical protein